MKVTKSKTLASYWTVEDPKTGKWWTVKVPENANPAIFNSALAEVNPTSRLGLRILRAVSKALAAGA